VSERASRLAFALSLAGALLCSIQGISVADPFVFSDGFESGNLSSWTGSSQMVVQQQLVEAGSSAARATTTGKAAYAYKKLSATYASLYYRVFFDLVSNTTPAVILRFRTASAAVVLTVGVNVSSKLYTNDPTTGRTTVGSSVKTGV
jgi:hypothetical protein